MWYVYMLRCADGALYIGQTHDVASRVMKHNQGAASHFTSCRLPVTLVYTESFPTRDDALKRERQIKRWTRAKKQALLAGDRALLKRL